MVTVATVVVFAAFALACLYGIGSPWQWGHNGFNGAAFWQAARNTLRFGIAGQALYYTGVEPPARDILYTHHPQMLHLHLVVLQRLLGDAPWVGRLVPAAYSLLTLALLHRIATRLWDRTTALVAVALYALVPLHGIFANMIDHEQGGIFWTLLAVYQYVRWVEPDPAESKRRRALRFGLVLFAITCGAQFDWPAYYVAFFVALHAFARVVRSRPVFAWRREWLFLLVFSAVVLASFVGFFAWIHAQRGSVREMGDAFAHRTGGVAWAYVVHTFEWMRDMHGGLPLVVTAAWAILLVARVARGGGRTRDLIPASFFGAQVIHSSVFRGAGWIHSYWTYWLGVATALGGAEVVLSAAAWARARVDHLRSTRGERLARASAVVLVIAASATTVMVVRNAYLRLRWGFATGTGSYVRPYPDIGAEVRWARWLAARFDRAATTYLVHASLPQIRIEVHWYLDAPFSDRNTLDATAPGAYGGKRVIGLLDAERFGARAQLAQLLREHPAWVFDRRFVALELSTRGERVETFRSAPRPASILWRWFVDPLHPPTDWVADDHDAVLEALGYDGQIVHQAEAGTATGTRMEWDCPRGQYVGALDGAPVEAPNLLLARLRARCRRTAPENGSLEGEVSPWWGGGSPLPEQTLACPDGQAVVGLAVRKGRFVDGLTVACAAVGAGAAGKPVTRGEPRLLDEWVGGPGGKQQALTCPPGTFVRGMRMRSGALVDAAGVACGTF